MVSPLVSEFANEKVVLLNPSQRERLPFPLRGIVRVLDRQGRTLAIVLDKDAWEDLLESLEYANPKFWEELEASRRSGRVSSKEIEHRLGIR